jgi:hypothetical protein
VLDDVIKAAAGLSGDGRRESSAEKVEARDGGEP